MGDSKSKWVTVTLLDGKTFRMPCAGDFQKTAFDFTAANPRKFTVTITGNKVSITEVEKTETKAKTNECRFGIKCNNSECTYPHPANWIRPPKVICRYGDNCKLGDKCKFLHSKDAE